MSLCPYCTACDDDAFLVAREAIALPASQPLTAGHCIVVPRRHVVELFQLDVPEQQAVWSVISTMRSRIQAIVNVPAFYLGFAEYFGEDGHMHIHLVPRALGVRLRLPEDIEWLIT